MLGGADDQEMRGATHHIHGERWSRRRGMMIDVLFNGTSSPSCYVIYRQARLRYSSSQVVRAIISLTFFSERCGLIHFIRTTLIVCRLHRKPLFHYAKSYLCFLLAHSAASACLARRFLCKCHLDLPSAFWGLFGMHCWLQQLFRVTHHLASEMRSSHSGL